MPRNNIIVLYSFIYHLKIVRDGTLSAEHKLSDFGCILFANEPGDKLFLSIVDFGPEHENIIITFVIIELSECLKLI